MGKRRLIRLIQEAALFLSDKYAVHTCKVVDGIKIFENAFGRTLFQVFYGFVISSGNETGMLAYIVRSGTAFAKALGA